MKTVYLSLGSNMGDREGYLMGALEALHSPPELRRAAVSSFYETEPIGLREQAWFLNMAAAFETELSPLQLLARTQEVERQFGRERDVANGPRTLDIDILFYGDAVLQTAAVTIPHARLRERRFVLEPLAEIAPDFPDPVSGEKISQLLAAVSSQSVRRL